MPNLYDLLITAFRRSPGLVFGITRDGRNAGFPDVSLPLSAFRGDEVRLTRMPSELEAYLRRGCALRLLDVNAVWLIPTTFIRRSDGEEYTCKATYTVLGAYGEAVARRLEGLRLGRFLTYVFGGENFYYIIPYVDEDVRREADDFLLSSGLRLEEYTPPWVTWGEAAGEGIKTGIGVRPSANRAGREIGRYLGYF